MNLSNLKPTPGSTHAKKRLGRGIGSGTGKTQEEDTKAKTPVAVAEPALDLKEDKHLCSNVCQNAGLLTLSARNMLV